MPHSITLSQLRYEVRPIGKRGHLQIFDAQENCFLPGVGYKAREFELAERHCAMWNRGGLNKPTSPQTFIASFAATH